MLRQVRTLNFLCVVHATWISLLFGCTEGDQEHFVKSETAVAITAPDEVTVKIFSAGEDLDGVQSPDIAHDEFMWLRPGRWVIEAQANDRAWYYPVTLQRYHSGPDRGGTFVVSIRKQGIGETPTVPEMEFSIIPSGWFLFGDRKNPLEPHFVWLTGYFLATQEVTNKQFREFLRSSTGGEEAGYWSEAGRAWRSRSTGHSSATFLPSNQDYKRFGQDDLPVTNVTWFEAHAFCRWLTGAYGGGKWIFGLPTEAEWEKGGRGPDDLEFGLSQRLSDRESSWYNWKKNPGVKETVVGDSVTRQRYRANRYGLYHMSGNVTEWTQSVSVPFNQQRKYRDDERNGDETPGQRVARGGSWYSASVALLSTYYRESFPPEHSTHELGFRVVARRLP